MSCISHKRERVRQEAVNNLTDYKAEVKNNPDCKRKAKARRLVVFAVGVAVHVVSSDV